MSEIDELTAHLAMHLSAGMAELAAAVGVSRATLFRRFPSRESLVAAASRRAVERYADAVETAAPEDGPSGEVYTGVIRGLGQRSRPPMDCWRCRSFRRHSRRSCSRQRKRSMTASSRSCVAANERASCAPTSRPPGC